MTDPIEKIFRINNPESQSFSPPGRQSPEIFDDFSVKKNIATRQGTVDKTPTTDKEIANKAYVDSLGAPEGTAVKSTGEGGGTKFLREDGDGTSSWQAIPDSYLLNSAADVGVGLTLTGDNESADTYYVPNVLYNTDAVPPAANTVPRGTIYIQYTA